MNRNDLAKLGSGIALELGVASGDFSEVLLSNPKFEKVFSIDMWANDTRHHTFEEYLSVLRRFHKYGTRSLVIRRMFEHMVPHFNNEVFNFIYIDGYAHTGQQAGKTMDDWWVKLKKGGIFAGHDYHPRWKPTMEAVDAFVKKHNLKLNLTNESGDGEFPSWFVTKK